MLLDALEDFGGTLIFRVTRSGTLRDKLATKVVDIGHGQALLYPGNYEEFLWSRQQQPEESRLHLLLAAARAARSPAPHRAAAVVAQTAADKPQTKAEAQVTYAERKRQEAEACRDKKAADERQRRIDELEARIADRERAIKEIESTMSAPGFYDNHDAAKPVIDKHQALMWEVGDLMNQWEALQTKL